MRSRILIPSNYGSGLHCFLNAPSLTESDPDDPALEPHFSLPRSSALGFTKVCYFSGASTVGSVIRRRHPATIFRLIVAVIIYAINLMRWTRFVSHIRVEILKRFKPSVAYFNSPSSVLVIAFVFGVVTTASKSIPASVLRASAFAMSDVYDLDALPVKASTGTRAVVEIGFSYDGQNTAIANAFCPAFREKFLDYQSSNSLSYFKRHCSRNQKQSYWSI